MKKILLLLLLLVPVFVMAQFPDTPRKLRLGTQTDANYLIYVQSGAPAHTPADGNDTYMVLDTSNHVLYYYDVPNSEWDTLTAAASTTRDTVYQLTAVPDTITTSPLQGDIFVNATADTLGVYNGAAWVLFFGGADLSGYATQTALQDTSAAIRADFPAPDGNGIYSGSGSLTTNTTITGGNFDFFLSNPDYFRRLYNSGFAEGWEDEGNNWWYSVLDDDLLNFGITRNAADNKRMQLTIDNGTDVGYFQFDANQDDGISKDVYSMWQQGASNTDTSTMGIYMIVDDFAGETAPVWSLARGTLAGTLPFEMIRVDMDNNVDNQISFYDKKYYFPNATPSATAGDTSVMVWAGSTPFFLDKSAFGGTGGGVTPYVSVENGTAEAFDTLDFTVNQSIISTPLYLQNTTVGSNRRVVVGYDMGLIDANEEIDDNDFIPYYQGAITRRATVDTLLGFDTLQLVGNTLRASLRNDGDPTYEVDLSSLGGGTTYTFTDGLTETNDTVRLGGTITGDIDLTTDGTVNLNIQSGAAQQDTLLRLATGYGADDAETVLLHLAQPNDSLGFRAFDDGIFTTSASGKGIVYDGDYSATFINRSLVDKAYVDAATAGGGGLSGSGTTNRLAKWDADTLTQSSLYEDANGIGVNRATIDDNLIIFGNTTKATAGTNNTGIGEDIFSATMDAGTTGNIAIGRAVLKSINSATADDNIGIGTAALLGVTSGAGNTAIGSFAGDAITTGSGNNFIGRRAGSAVNTGSENFGFGENTLTTLTNGSLNVAVGASAGRFIAGASSRSVLLGNQAGQNLQTNTGIIGIGDRAFGSASTADVDRDFSYSIAIGYLAGYSSDDNDNVIFLGYEAGKDNANSNVMALGYQASASANDQITIGSSSYTTARFPITGALTIPTGTTAQRPTAETGMTRWNSTDGTLEAYDGGAWVQYSPDEHGSASGTTDASGDLTVSHNFGTASITVTATATGTTFSNVQVHSKTTTNFKIRFFDAAGAAQTSTATAADWIAKKQ